MLGCKQEANEWSYQEALGNDGPSLTAHIEFLEKRLEQRPQAFLQQAELAEFYLQRGKAKRQSEDFEAARKWAELSLSRHDNPAARLVLADYFQTRHDFERSLEAIDAVLKTDPFSLKAVMLGIQVALAQGNIEEAQRRLKSLPEVPLSSHLFLRGQVAEAAGNPQEARSFYQEAIQREADSGFKSESARMRGVLARLEIEQGRLNEAEKLLQAAHAIPVEQPLTEVLRARLMELDGRRSEAADLLRAAFEHYRDPVFLVRLGEVQQAAGKSHEAHSSFSAAAQLLEADPFGHERDLALALFHLDAKKNAQRIQELMKTELERRSDPETRRIADLVIPRDPE